ncbi:Cobalamin biosynthesis protein CbiG / Cobalt-precorrin-3b C17-methyltransferase [Paramagnetospirillum magnetotacticum MS-1]|uniref:Cobalamin biosynthesis protein CbiG / Cobalt-precorrin-3b C17-methyltransferase n=1 Tax=Paramagnetospirillum magnetotacticum MS-1 TaxID=272627 RepID=A0A0C2U9L7_PARME|nr:precorrin-3B C(17)-methyltransferase [Paramagnetospirillum magnetotacticum]KIL98192.1 Cobalamin biosynthesis protein CbiG / Cobalt-precorrin-3b C17-methyltransferase [Paramagnetospirillum magnetotacticum MS-1]
MAVEIALVVVTPAGLETARALKAVLPGASIHGLAGRVEGDVGFLDTSAHLRALFAARTPIIGICAAGILIRSLGPVLGDKQSEPPVLAVGVDGSSVVPLLGGHHGGNALAREIGRVLDVPPALTTAGELALGVALDDPPTGWRVGNPQAAKSVTAALLAEEPVALEVETGDGQWLNGLPFVEKADHAIRITDRSVEFDDHELVLHPPTLVLGVGCERNAPAAELISLVKDVMAQEALSPKSIACVASIDLKADEGAVHDLAAELGVPARFFSAAELEAETPRLASPSDVVFAETGCHGVAEGAALAVAGADGVLIVPKVKGARTTMALARSPRAIDAQGKGRARGKLFVVGIGPGTPQWRSPEASAAIEASSDLVGYGLYLDLLGHAVHGKARHESALGAEEARAAKALDLAAEGRNVSLVCSGDPGIYALATLVFELLDRKKRADWNRVEVVVVPGISALQAAAARAGAPVNHDFCTISLSDLLTPWESIETRLKAAAMADFVVCFYNPVSQRRRDQLPRARDILLSGRGPDTPVILARQLGRAGETVEVIRLADLDADKVDMLTMVVVGSSETRSFAAGQKTWTYTPRGYGKKMV